MCNKIKITELHSNFADLVSISLNLINLERISGSSQCFIGLYGMLIKTCYEIDCLFLELTVPVTDKKFEKINSKIKEKCLILSEQKASFSKGATQVTQSFNDCVENCDCQDYDSCVTCSTLLYGFRKPESGTYCRRLSIEKVKDISNKMRDCGTTLPFYVRTIRNINS
jgi:hypothetical protein